MNPATVPAGSASTSGAIQDVAAANWAPSCITSWRAPSASGTRVSSSERIEAYELILPNSLARPK